MPYEYYIVLIVLKIILDIYLVYHWRRRKIQANIHGPTITVTTQGQPINPRPQDTVAPPYPPMDPRHPTPYSAGPPGPGFNTPYAQNQYQPGPETPYPPTAYPPPPVNSSYYQANNDPHANPPPYHVAVSTGPVAPTTQEGYTKQAPYNPNY